jgi:hypothetical protein
MVCVLRTAVREGCDGHVGVMFTRHQGSAGKTIVVKYGGAAMKDPTLKEGCCVLPEALSHLLAVSNPVVCCRPLPCATIHNTHFHWLPLSLLLFHSLCPRLV